MKKLIFNYIFWLLPIQYALAYFISESLEVFDKLVVAAGLLLLSFNSQFLIRHKKYFFLFVCFIFVGLVGNYVSGYFCRAAVLNDLFLFCKFPVALSVGYLFASRYGGRFVTVKNVRKKVQAVAILFFSLCLLNYAIAFFPVIDAYSLGPIKCISLFFRHPTFFCGTMIFFLSVFLYVFKKNLTDIVILFMLVCCIVTTTRMKGILAVAIVVYLVLKFKKSKSFSLKYYDYILMLIGSLYIALEKFVFYFVDSASYARGLIFFNSLKLAKYFSPFGAGIGSFASSGSVKYLSPFYYKLGMYNESKFFANDSFVGTILSQTGFIGLFLFLLFLLILLKKTYALRNSSNAFLSAATIVIYLMISCVAEVSFFAIYAVPMSFWLGVLFCLHHPSKQIR